MPLTATGLQEMLASSRGTEHPAAVDVEPETRFSLVLGAAALAVVLAGAGALWYRRRRGVTLRVNRAGPDGI